MRATIGRPATGSTAEGVNGTRRQLIGPSKSETYRKRPGPDDPLVTPRSGWSTGTRRKPPPPCGAAILPYWGGGRFCEFPIGGAHCGQARRARPGSDRTTPTMARWALHGRRSLCHAGMPAGSRPSVQRETCGQERQRTPQVAQPITNSSRHECMSTTGVRSYTT
jgi:hypothetical protein